MSRDMHCNMRNTPLAAPSKLWLPMVQESYFLFPKKEAGLRPVVNFRRLNEFIPLVHFEVEGIHTLRDVLKKDDWLTKVDLKDAYFIIPVHQSNRSMLPFRLGVCYSSLHVYHLAYCALHGSLPRP